MAAITFNAEDRCRRVVAPAAGACAAVLPNAREMLDGLARKPMPHDATEQACARHPLGLGALPAQHASFGPLDPNVLNESIAAFFIGRNADGFWVARERSGRIGGIFLLRSSALAFAHRHAGGAACATIFPADGFELDIENDGNRMLSRIAPLMRSVARLYRRVSKRILAS